MTHPKMPTREELATLNEQAGFITARRNRLTGGLNVLYDGIAAGLDTASGRWQTVCEVHGTICSHTSRKVAAAHLNSADWCEACTDSM